MKVKLNSTVSSCLIGGREYKQGDIFEVTPEQFTDHIMIEVDAPVEEETVLEEVNVIEKVPVEVVIEPIPTDEAPEKVVSKKRSKKRESTSTFSEDSGDYSA